MTPGFSRKESLLLLEEQQLFLDFLCHFLFSACENPLGYLFMKLCLDMVFFFKYPLVYTLTSNGTCCVHQAALELTICFLPLFSQCRD